jgi:peptide-methionine (R)-S-oxide reductase
MSDKDKWRDKLSPEQFAVCWEKATERPFSGTLLRNDKEGTYLCVCCQATIFSSQAKFDAGCGWPSFSESFAKDAIRYESDTSHGMVRTEILCNSCGAHLGHVFDDGPQPTGRRYCVNSLSMTFKADVQSNE